MPYFNFNSKSVQLYNFELNKLSQMTIEHEIPLYSRTIKINDS